MLLNFPCVVEEVNYLDINDLLVYIKSGSLVEAQMPNGVLKLSDDKKFLIFEGDEVKEGTTIKGKDNDTIKNWIKERYPKVTEEEKREQEAREAEYDLRACALSEACSEKEYEYDEYEPYY